MQAFGSGRRNSTSSRRSSKRPLKARYNPSQPPRPVSQDFRRGFQRSPVNRLLRSPCAVGHLPPRCPSRRRRCEWGRRPLQHPYLHFLRRRTQPTLTKLLRRALRRLFIRDGLAAFRRPPFQRPHRVDLTRLRRLRPLRPRRRHCLRVPVLPNRLPFRPLRPVLKRRPRCVRCDLRLPRSNSGWKSLTCQTPSSSIMRKTRPFEHPSRRKCQTRVRTLQSPRRRAH